MMLNFIQNPNCRLKYLNKKVKNNVEKEIIRWIETNKIPLNLLQSKIKWYFNSRDHLEAPIFLR